MFSHFRRHGSANCFRVLACCLAIFVLCLDAAGQARRGFWTVLRSLEGGVGGSIREAVVQPDGRILVVGFFSQVDLRDRDRMARLHPDGSVDLSFVPATQVEDFVLQPDGKIVVWEGPGAADGRRIRRLNSDGSLDPTFIPVSISHGNMGTTIRAMAMALDGKIYVVGDFSVIGGVTRRWVARLNPDGSVDQTYADVNPVVSNPNLQPFVYSLSVRPDGKLLVGGRFETIAGVARVNIALLDTNGSADTSFDAGLTVQQTVSRITPVEAGKLLISGGGLIERRVFATGSIDSSFAPPPGINDCRPQTAGKYVCRYPQFVRLNASDGSVDPSFSAQAGGAFVTILPDGTVLLSGFGPARTLTRLTIDGALDDPAAARSDFNGDLRTDVSVFRPSTGEWFVRMDNGWYSVMNWGVATDQIVPADYDGDAVTDYAVFRGSDSNWYIVNSSDNTITVNSWGQEGDVPLAADYDNDRKAERVIYRPSESKLYVLSTKYGIQPARTAGLAGDKPLVGDFDGDNIADSVFYRPSSGHWLLQMTTNPTFVIRQWGQPGDIPVPADYDGDRVTDFAIYRPSTGEWWHRTSSSPLSFIVRQWGEPGDIPVPGDYDGDGVADRAIFRPSTNTWHILGSQAGWERLQFGEAGDIPTPGVY